MLDNGLALAPDFHLPWQASRQHRDMNTRPGRNDPCYCGSGKKYKRCHLPLDEQARPAPALPRAEAADETRKDVDETAPAWGRGPGASKDLGGVFKLLARSGLTKRDPALRRFFKGKETLVRYLGHMAEIEAAWVKLEPYEEQFRKLLDDEDAFARRCQKLFDEESFAPLRFTAADLQKAFEKVGFPPNMEAPEQVWKILLAAIRFLASEERQEELAMELMLRMPKYVEEGRFMDARLIRFVAGAAPEEQVEVNPFLRQMFFDGLRAWGAEQKADKEAVLRELGLHRRKKMGPDEIEAWAAEAAADPAKAARLQRLIDAHAGLRGQAAATADALRGHTAELLERQDAACLMLRAEEFEPWMPFVTEKLKGLFEKYGQPPGGAPPSEAERKEAFATVYLPAMRELAKGIFTPERIRKLVADLKVYRQSLFEAGENSAVFYATAVINYVEPEDDPSQNVFLVNLCARSLHGIGSGPDERRGEEDGGL